MSIKLNKEQLEELEKLGGLQFPVSECAIILQLDESELEKMMTENKEVKNTYERGRLKASSEVRQAILNQAKQGSSPAQKQMLELIQNINKSSKLTKGKNINMFGRA